MDSSALFIVSALVREMIQICENNAIGVDPVAKADYIKQIFILTHNAYFHREITYNQVKNYLFVNFYLISKIDNKSSIKLCTKVNPEIMTEEINYNPVQNSYAALWEEYKEINAPIPLMNVIRRILEYYFLQLCGYDGVTLRKRILIDNKDKFITTDANGKEDYTQYQMAHAWRSGACFGRLVRTPYNVVGRNRYGYNYGRLADNERIGAFRYRSVQAIPGQFLPEYGLERWKHIPYNFLGSSHWICFCTDDRNGWGICSSSCVRCHIWIYNEKACDSYRCASAVLPGDLYSASRDFSIHSVQNTDATLPG